MLGSPRKLCRFSCGFVALLLTLLWLPAVLSAQTAAAEQLQQLQQIRLD